MSGTSLDGIDAALVRIEGDPPTVRLLAFRNDPYEAPARRRLLEVIERGGPRDLALLHVDLGAWFADATQRLLADAGVTADRLAFIASHGQTVWHEPGRASLQLGDPAVIAERTGVRVVSDFRSRDVAAGGQGAPLVPIADALLFGADGGGRVLLNVGGMANATWVPRRGATEGMVAFDTGPGMALVDAVVRAKVPDVRFDEDGQRAARGQVMQSVVEATLADPYFAAPPPKSTGRERFGEAAAARLAAAVHEAGGSGDDAIATALAVTVQSVAGQLERWLPTGWVGDVVVSGGGARNRAFMASLADAMPHRALRRFTDLFFDGDAKEAVAFALLGWLTLAGRSGNVPGATGARGPRVLGRMTPA